MDGVVQVSDQNFAIVHGIRDARALVFSTWLRSFQATNDFAKRLPRDAFFASHHQVIERILARGATVTLAVLPDDHSVVFGWAVTEGPATVHYVYVKPDFRKFGIARALLEHVEKPFIYSHTTNKASQLSHKLVNCAYNPYAV